MYCGKFKDIIELNFDEEYDRNLFYQWLNEAKTKVPTGNHNFTNLELVLLKTVESLVEKCIDLKADVELTKSQKGGV